MLHSDWLPEWARWAHLGRPGFPTFVLVFGHMIKFGHSSVKIAGYWPCYFYFDLDFASINKNAKKRLVNNAYLLLIY